MGMGFAPTWLRQVSPPASQNHFNYGINVPPRWFLWNFVTTVGSQN